MMTRRDSSCEVGDAGYVSITVLPKEHRDFVSGGRCFFVPKSKDG
jgi:hypothetical protein